MRTYIYTYEHGNNDIKGNPRHWITVFRVKRNVPVKLGERKSVGYRGEIQAACNIIQAHEPWSKKEQYFPNGDSCNAAYMAASEGAIKIIRISKVKVR